MRQLGSAGSDVAYGVAVDGTGNAYITGSTDGSLGGPNAGGNDAFLAKYGPPPCYPNCDASTAAPLLNVNDFVCFLNSFAAGTTYANCDHSTTAPVLNIQDFICFLNAFAAGTTYANCDHSTTAPTLNVLDFTCFLNAFASGCP